MAKYRLNRPGVIGSAKLAAGDIIDLPDHVPPHRSWQPLDAAAHAAVQKHTKPFTIAANGIQAVDRKTGYVMITRHGEKIPRPMHPKVRPVDPQPPRPVHKRTPAEVAAEVVAERQKAFSAEPDAEDPADRGNAHRRAYADLDARLTLLERKGR